jgi:hypothetical protein
VVSTFFAGAFFPVAFATGAVLATGAVFAAGAVFPAAGAAVFAAGAAFFFDVSCLAVPWANPALAHISTSAATANVDLRDMQSSDGVRSGAQTRGAIVAVVGMRPDVHQAAYMLAIPGPKRNREADLPGGSDQASPRAGMHDGAGSGAPGGSPSPE